MILHSGIKDDGSNFQVVPSTRKIIVPQSHKVIGTVGSHNSEQLTFQCPKTIDGHDVTTCSNHYVSWEISNGDSGKYDIPADNITVDDENMYLTWIIEGRITVVPGVVGFALHFEDKVNDELLYSWGTTECKECQILNTIKNSTNNGVVNIPDGYVKPDGRISITENGTHDVGKYKYAVVRVLDVESGATRPATPTLIADENNVMFTVEDKINDPNDVEFYAVFIGDMIFPLPTSYVNTPMPLALLMASHITNGKDVTIYVYAVGKDGILSGESNSISFTFAAPSYDIKYQISNVTADRNNPKQCLGDNSICKLRVYADEGYVLPDNISVGNVSRYVWDKETGTIIMSGAYDSPYVYITAIKVDEEPEETYPITLNLSNVTKVSGETIVNTSGRISTISFAGTVGFRPPRNITVIGCEYDWFAETGTLLLYNATSNVVVTMIGEVDYYTYIIRNGVYNLHNDGRNFNTSDENIVIRNYEHTAWCTYSGFECNELIITPSGNMLAVRASDGYILDYSGINFCMIKQDVKVTEEMYNAFRFYMEDIENGSDSVDDYTYVIPSGTYSIYDEGRDFNTANTSVVIRNYENTAWCTFNGYECTELIVTASGDIYGEKASDNSLFALKGTAFCKIEQDVSVTKIMYDMFMSYATVAEDTESGYSGTYGTYILDEDVAAKVANDDAYKGSATFSVHFLANGGKEYTGLVVYKLESLNDLFYYNSDGKGYGSVTNSEAFRTITLLEEPSEKFYEFLDKYATPTGIDARYPIELGAYRLRDLGLYYNDTNEDIRIEDNNGEVWFRWNERDCTAIIVHPEGRIEVEAGTTHSIEPGTFHDIEVTKKIRVTKTKYDAFANYTFKM